MKKPFTYLFLMNNPNKRRSVFRLFFIGLFTFMLFACAANNTSEQSAQVSSNNTNRVVPYIPQGTRNTDPSEGKLKGQTLKLKRALLMVKDLKRSVEFYQNVLGFEVYAVDQNYNDDQTGIGVEIFNTPNGTSRRLAYLNTSAESRGLALREIDATFEVPQHPRIGTILFEASDILGIQERLVNADAKVIGPTLAMSTAQENIPQRRYIEMGVVDPDGHVLAFFKYYTNSAEDEAEWQKAIKIHDVTVE